MKTGREKGRELFPPLPGLNPEKTRGLHSEDPRLSFPDSQPKSAPVWEQLPDSFSFFFLKLYLLNTGFREVCLADMSESTPQPV